MNTVWRAVFDYVDQSIAPANFQNFNTATATNTFSFATGLTVTENDQAVKVVSTLRAGNTTPRTITGFGTNWTISNQNTYNVTDGVRNAVGNRSYNATATPVADVSTTNLNGSALPSMTAVSLKAIPKQFRSNATGPWGTIDTWQQSMNLGTSWVAATTTPSSSDHSVTIRNTHVVTLNSAAGAWINLGTFNPGTSTIQFSNAAATMADVPPPYTSFYNLTVQDGAKLTFGTGSYAKILNTQLMMEYYYCPHWQVGMDY